MMRKCNVVKGGMCRSSLTPEHREEKDKKERTQWVNEKMEKRSKEDRGLGFRLYW